MWDSKNMGRVMEDWLLVRFVTVDLFMVPSYLFPVPGSGGFFAGEVVCGGGSPSHGDFCSDFRQMVVVRIGSCQRGGVEGGRLGVWHGHAHTAVLKFCDQQELLVSTGNAAQYSNDLNGKIT